MCYCVHSELLNDIVYIVKADCQNCSIHSLNLPLLCRSQLATLAKLVCIEIKDGSNYSKEYVLSKPHTNAHMTLLEKYIPCPHITYNVSLNIATIENITPKMHHWSIVVLFKKRSNNVFERGYHKTMDPTYKQLIDVHQCWPCEKAYRAWPMYYVILVDPTCYTLNRALRIKLLDKKDSTTLFGVLWHITCQI